MDRRVNIVKLRSFSAQREGNVLSLTLMFGYTCAETITHSTPCSDPVQDELIILNCLHDDSITPIWPNSNMFF